MKNLWTITRDTNPNAWKLASRFLEEAISQDANVREVRKACEIVRDMMDVELERIQLPELSGKANTALQYLIERG